MMFTFLKAKGVEVGGSILEQEKIPLAKEIIEAAEKSKAAFLLPVDAVIADRFENEANRKTVGVNSITPGWSGLDIGPETVRLYSKELARAATIVWNGPMGVFEMSNFAAGTEAIAKILADRTAGGAVTIVGGGDSAAAITKLNLEKRVSHVSTGGGASLEFLEGKVLPGVAALTDA
jgi:phosphoglycerate kinase